MPQGERPAAAQLTELSLFQRVLLATDGTVTDLIALYTGEPIRVVKLAQSIALRDAPDALKCEGPARLLHREILLSGAERQYLHADSLFVFERLSESIQAQLLHTDKPIGLLWKQERLETYREIVRHAIAPQPALAPQFGLPATARFVSRTYLVHHKQRPLGRITESWPLEALR